MAPLKNKITPEEAILEIYRGDEIFIPNREFTGYASERPGSSSIDIPIDEATPNVTFYQFGSSPNDKVELHIYSMVDSLMESTYDIPYNRVAGLLRPPQPNTFNVWGASDDMGLNSVKINLHSVFRDLGYISGRFKFQLNFHRNVLGTADAPASLIGVSSDRTELTVLCSGSIQNILQAPKVDQYGNRTEFYINIGDNKLYRVANFDQDTLASNNKGNVYVLALQEPLPGEIGTGIPIWVDIQSADPQKDVIVIYPKKKKQTYNDIKGPNFNIETNEGIAQSTAFRSWDSLLGSNATTSQQLINNLISSSFDLTELAIDYRDYSQFVFYSSAQERLENFKYKLELLEYYDGLISVNSSIPSPSIEVTNNISDLTVKRNAILSGFDGYEKYLYYESSSYETSSYGEFTPTTWPKSNATRPYTNYSVTSAEGTAWYTGQLESASLYDNGNRNALQYLIPEHIRESRNNEPYTAFVNMMGQHFDILWSYVHHLTRIHSREDSLFKGLAKDLVYHVLRSLGVDSINGFRVEELWFQSLGLNESGQYTQSGSLQSIPTGDISKETWKRILNNLPYLLKTKGTKRGIRALLNCYGVPSTVYRVKEYSGPYQYKSTTFDISAQHRRVEKYTLAVRFNGTNTIQTSKSILNACSTIMFRFRPATGSSTNIGNNMTLTYVDGHEDKLDIGGAILTGPWYARDAYTGDRRWTTVATVGGTTYAFQSLDGRVLEYSAAGGAISDTFGSSNAHVDVQEFKGWSSALDVEVLREIARNPQSIIGSSTVETYSVPGWQLGNDYNYTTAYNEMIFRFPMGTTLQMYTGSTMPSIHPKQSSPANANISTITTASYVPNHEIYYVWYPNLGDNLDLSEKIRIQPPNTITELHRYYSLNTETENSDFYSFDSNKLGVFFSPQDEINEDIADQFSGLSIDDILGDPRDDYNPTYAGLEKLRHHYNLKFTGDNSFWKYIKLIENFDASMFYLIKKFLPARSVKLVGLVIQPTLLERPKTYIRPTEYEREDFESTLPGYYTTLDGSDAQLNAEPIIIERNQFAESVAYLDNIDNSKPSILSGAVDELYTGVAAVQHSALSINVDFVNESANLNFLPAGKFNHCFAGCKMSSRGFNIPSLETPDGGPVVEFWTNDPNNPIHSPNQGGALAFATGDGRRTAGVVPAAITGRVKTNTLDGKVITNNPVLGATSRLGAQPSGVGLDTPYVPEGKVITNTPLTTAFTKFTGLLPNQNPGTTYVPEGKVITNRNQA